eukprot:scaffold5567_cov202-Alexandrium_tamarense.AAC.13
MVQFGERNTTLTCPEWPLNVASLWAAQLSMTRRMGSFVGSFDIKAISSHGLRKQPGFAALPSLMILSGTKSDPSAFVYTTLSFDF